MGLVEELGYSCIVILEDCIACLDKKLEVWL